MTGAPKVIGFVCDWSVDLVPLTKEGRLRELPSVTIIRVPCSGFVRSSWMEDALSKGADGVFVTGCPYGDCVNREGNYLMRDRVDQLQRRLQRRRVDQARLGMLAYGLHDGPAFLDAVRGLLERLRRLAAAAPARTAAPAAPAPAGAEGEGL